MSWEKINDSFREQAKGDRCYIKSDFVPLRACLKRDAETIIGPDPGTPEYANMFKKSSDEKFLNYLRKIQKQVHLANNFFIWEK